jgi:uncharacterized protein (TIGR03435 family)
MIARFASPAAKLGSAAKASNAGRLDSKGSWLKGQGRSVQWLGPSIFTAIKEQLGLRLESRKTPVEAIVIQSAEKAEN